MPMRFNHMELTVPKGTLTDDRRQELTDFYGGVFGWETRDVEILGGRQFFMQPTEGQFILVAESSKRSPPRAMSTLPRQGRSRRDQTLRRPRESQHRRPRVLRAALVADLVRRAGARAQARRAGAREVVAVRLTFLCGCAATRRPRGDIADETSGSCDAYEAEQGTTARG